ncbi:hypothetical protein Pelo_18713 [Pelomyxa schiedti]|nr:hypothetical protein Pelo_18713 [Pelomyxa schiedti]
MFDSGVMVPVDTVRVPIPRALVSPIAHCFWASKRVMVQSKGAYYELLKGGELKLLCKNPHHNLFLENFWISQSKDQPNQCESWDFSCTATGDHPQVISLPVCDVNNPVHLGCVGDSLVVEEASKVHVNRSNSVMNRMSRPVVWAIEPHLRYRDQFVALMVSSHARCGRLSPAAALTTSAPLLVASLHESWSAGLVVLESHTLGASVSVGVSLATMGVTDPPLRHKHQMPGGPATAMGASPSWMTGTRCVVPPDLGSGRHSEVLDVGTGQRAEVRGLVGLSLMRFECRGEWILDPGDWKMWRVGVDCGNGARDGDRRGGSLVVTGPRTVTPFRGMGTRGDADAFYFGKLVGDRFFDMRSLGAEWCVFRLFDMRRMFESGVMAAVDSVKVVRPKQLSYAHCFWPSKRVMMFSRGVVYEILKSGELKLLCSNPSNNLFLENFWISQTRDQPNQCESWDFSVSAKAEQPTVISLPKYDGCNPVNLKEGGNLLVVDEASQTHVVDPASGVFIFTLKSTSHKSRLHCVGNVFVE